MNGNPGTIKPSAGSSVNESPRTRYNPFRKFPRKTKRSRHEKDDAFQDSNSSPSPLPKIIAQDHRPSTVGQLFASTELRSDLAANGDLSSGGPELHDSSAQRGRLVDEEQISLRLVDSESQLNPWRPNFLLNTLGRAYVDSTSPQLKASSLEQSVLNFRYDTRKRRVIVVEFGNTDNLTEVTSETVCQSWKDPIYSEMAVPGYPIKEKGQSQSRASSALGKPLKESLRKLMPQKGTANMRLFYIQDDREAFLSLGQAFHMTFFNHRTNYRAWAVGPSNISGPEKSQWRWLDHLAVHLSPVQTMFWRPDRTGDLLRTAFGMDYPAVHLVEKSVDIMDEDPHEGQRSESLDVWRVPETSEQRVSVYVQLKKQATPAQYPSGASLGLSENSIIILDSMRRQVTRDELLDGVLSLKRLMSDIDVEDPLTGNPVLIATIRLIFDAVAGKWSDYILTMQNYIVSVEEVIYSQPANDRYSPLLWNISKLLLQAERLLKFHLHLVENVQNGMLDITGPGTMEPDWLRQNIKEFSRLSVEVEESLKKPVAQMVDLMYKSIGIRDARQSLELNTSLWRLSWITFIFLPLGVLGTLFGMNVAELSSAPSVKWYFTAAVPLMLFVMISYLSARKLMRKDIDTTQFLHPSGSPKIPSCGSK